MSHRNKINDSKKVVILSPSPYSLYTICVTELLRRQGVQIASIFVRRLLNPHRFISEFSRDGSRLLKKIGQKLVLKEKYYRARHYETRVEFMKKEKIFIKKVDHFKTRYNIPVIYCNDLNDSHVVLELKKIKPKLVVFTGGGLIRKDLLNNSGAGILNCHMGLLPQYRGMDVIEWAILENKSDHIGMTVHFMDKGVDTGDIVRSRKVEFVLGETIKQIRQKFKPLMCRELVAACLDYMNNNLTRKPQKHEQGKQYFTMHPCLMEIVKRNLREEYD